MTSTPATEAEHTEATDPRRSLRTNATGFDRSQPIAAAQYLDFQQSTATPCEAGSVWTVRGQNALLHYVAVSRPGLVLETELASESVLVCVAEDSSTSVTWNRTTSYVQGKGLAIVPPGRVRIDAAGDGDLVLLLRADEPGWQGAAVNDSAYAEPAPRVAPADPWPEPVGEPRVRVYHIEAYPPEEGRFGWIFRSRSFMVNFLPPQQGPRDPRQFSPHHHDDFEQYSLAVEGEFVHHIRTPWLRDHTQWRDDEHVMIGSPSLTVIPPPTIHTSAASGGGRNVLIDIFSPPRVDFSEQPGWVLNSEEFPQP